MNPDSAGRALVTGASSGIGREITRGLARRGYDLTLVGRRRDQLDALQSELAACHGIRTCAQTLDLSEASHVDRLVADLERDPEPWSVLVNNAGFGVYGEFTTTDWDAEARMIAVHIVAATRLAKVICRSMRRTGSGRILNVASTSAFKPGPLGAVYAATKAYTLSLSEALAEELRGSGITVTALCPGYTLTEFMSRALSGGTEAPPRHAMAPAAVAEIGLVAMFGGKRIVVPGVANQVHVLLVGLLPRSSVAWLTRRVRAGRHGGERNRR